MARVRGAKERAAKLRDLTGAELARRIGQALYAGANLIQTEAQLSITRGAVSGKAHVPSRPGEPPNQDTGVLANNIEAALITPFKAEVSSNAPYAAVLEYGGSKVAARPYMRPAVEKCRAEVTALVRRAIPSGALRTSTQRGG